MSIRKNAHIRLQSIKKKRFHCKTTFVTHFLKTKWKNNTWACLLLSLKDDFLPAMLGFAFRIKTLIVHRSVFIDLKIPQKVLSTNKTNKKSWTWNSLSYKLGIFFYRRNFCALKFAVFIRYYRSIELIKLRKAVKLKSFQMIYYLVCKNSRFMPAKVRNHWRTFKTKLYQFNGLIEADASVYCYQHYHD